MEEYKCTLEKKVKVLIYLWRKNNKCKSSNAKEAKKCPYRELIDGK